MSCKLSSNTDKLSNRIMFSLGCSVLVGLESGKVLDLDTRTKSCTSCKKGFEHSTCYRNHTGSSGSMEVGGIVAMMNRSLAENLRYTEFIGDGDSSVELALKTEVTYGAEITKTDCLNHKVKVNYSDGSISILSKISIVSFSKLDVF